MMIFCFHFLDLPNMIFFSRVVRRDEHGRGGDDCGGGGERSDGCDGDGGALHGRLDLAVVMVTGRP